METTTYEGQLVEAFIQYARDADVEDAADRGLRTVTMAAAWKAAAGPEEVDELDRTEDLAGGP